MAVRVKRVYELAVSGTSPASGEDGVRVLVDRLWPRGVAKGEAKIDLWLKEVAPSAALRKWFGHDPRKWDGFRERYARELDAAPEAVAQLRKLARRGTVTLVYAAKDPEHNNAVALQQYLRAKR